MPCEHEKICLGSKWRMPKRNNKKAWRMIEQGDIWWDKKAIAKKEIQVNKFIDAIKHKKSISKKLLNKLR